MMGYNDKRQRELFRMKRDELEDLLGRNIPTNERGAFTDAVKEQLEIEGFKYLDRYELMRKDPTFRVCAGIKDKPGDVKRDDLIDRDLYLDALRRLGKITRADKIKFWFVIATIACFVFVWFVGIVKPPLPNINIGTSYSSWLHDHSNIDKTYYVYADGERYKVVETTEENVLGGTANISYLFGSDDKLECASITFLSEADANCFFRKFGYGEKVENGRLYFKGGLNYDVIKHFGKFYMNKYYPKLDEQFFIQKKENTNTKRDFIRIMGYRWK